MHTGCELFIREDRVWPVRDRRASPNLLAGLFSSLDTPRGTRSLCVRCGSQHPRKVMLYPSLELSAPSWVPFSSVTHHSCADCSGDHCIHRDVQNGWTPSLPLPRVGEKTPALPPVASTPVLSSFSLYVRKYPISPPILPASSYCSFP